MPLPGLRGLLPLLVVVVLREGRLGGGGVFCGGEVMRSEGPWHLRAGRGWGGEGREDGRGWQGPHRCGDCRLDTHFSCCFLNNNTDGNR